MLSQQRVKSLRCILLIVGTLNLTLSSLAFGQWHPSEGIFTNSVDWICTTPKGVLAIHAPYAFRSTDNGTSWEYLASSRTRSNSFYQAGSIIYNIADSLYRSTDWGETWQFVSAWPGAIRAFHPIAERHDTLFLATNRGPFFSVDGGYQWSIVPFTTGGKVLMYAFDDVMLMTETDLSDIIVHRSLDGGRSWEHFKTELSEDAPTDFMEHGGKLFATGFNGVYVSTDKAQTWSKLSVVGTNFANLIDGGQSIYVLESGRIHRSDDSGATWTECSLPAREFATSLVADDLTVYCGSRSTGVWTSTDRGASWTGPGATGYTARSLFVTQDGIIAADDSLGFLRSHDLGRHWTREQPAGLPHNGSMRFGGVDTLIFAQNGIGGIYRSRDAGHSWIYSDSGLKYTVPNVFYEGFVNVFGKTFMFGSPGLFRWDNDSVKWVYVSFGTVPDIIILSLNSMGNALVVTPTAGPTLRSLDTGNTWLGDTLNWPAGIGPHGMLYGVVHDRFAMYGIGQDQAMYRSLDSGLTWAQFTFEPTSGYRPIVRSLLATQEHLFVYEEAGLWSSGDGGATWISVSSGLEKPPFSVVESSGVFLASTTGYGNWWMQSHGSSVVRERPVNRQQMYFSASPQPATRRVNVSYESDNSPILEISLFDEIGRKVWSAAEPAVAAHDGEIALEVSAFPSGAYHLVLRTGLEMRTIPILVSH